MFFLTSFRFLFLFWLVVIKNLYGMVLKNQVKINNRELSYQNNLN